MSQGDVGGKGRPARIPARGRERVPASWVRALVLRAAAAALVAAVCLAVRPSAGAPEERPLRLQGLAPERAEVNLVLVDVLARLRDGSPARGLKQDDFDLLIDRLPAPIHTFEDHCPQPPPSAAAPEAAPGEAAAADRAEPRHVVLFFDLNHLTRAGRDRSLDSALRFVRREMSAADRVMLVAMKGRPILLEPFTSDRERLAARLEAAKADDGLLDLTVLEERLNVLDVLRRACPEGGGFCQQRANAAAPYAQAEEARARRSLTALRSLMPALAAIRGRKTVVHFSETLRDEPGLQYLLLAGSTPQREGINLKPLLQDLHKEANAAGVSFYMVFAAGLGESGSTGFSDASVSVSTADAALVDRAKIAGEDAALGLETTLALETGGAALKRSNDLAKIFTAVADDLTCYYVLGYLNPGPGDGRRHSIIVKPKAKGLDLRHRPYYEDLSDAEKLERRFRSALLAPEYFREIPAAVAAFSLAPGGKTVPFLVKVEFPLGEVTFVKRSAEERYGEAEVRGTVWSGQKDVCSFSRRIPITLHADEPTAGRGVIYEAGCKLAPGQYDLTVAVLDAGSGEMGGAQAGLPVRGRSAGVAGDVVLWTSSGGDFLVAADAASVGIRDTGAGHGFVPRLERRFGERESGLLYVVVCPEPVKGEEPGAVPVEVKRTIYAGETAVATFPTVRLGGRPDGAGPGGEADPAAGGGPGACEGIFAPIPPGRLGPGGYTYEVEVSGLGEYPIVHRAGFEVRAAPAAEGASISGAP